MIRHIVSWNYKEEFSETQREENSRKIKMELENLIQKIDGLIELKVHTNLLPSSNRDIAINSLFADGEALAAYLAHPDHVRIGSFIGSVTKERACIDYDE